MMLPRVMLKLLAHVAHQHTRKMSWIIRWCVLEVLLALCPGYHLSHVLFRAGLLIADTSLFGLTGSACREKL